MVQIARFLVTVNSGVTVRFRIRIVSQPAVVLATVSFNVPAAVNTCPNQVYGSLSAQIVRSLTTVRLGLTDSVNVLIVSQPPVVLATVSFKVPAAVNTWPNQVYGNWLVQIASVLVTVNNCVTVRLRVRIVSQPPVVLATVSFNVPAAVNTCPNQVYGS